MAACCVLASLILSATVGGYLDGPVMKRTVVRSLAPNFGEVAEGVFRSGQATPPFLGWTWKIYRFRTVINLAWSGRPTDLAEERFLSEHGVTYRKFSWSPDGPPDATEMRAALDAVDHGARPVLIHCRAGRDRTGGLVGYWRISHGCSLAQVEQDWLSFGTPSPGWQRALEEDSRRPFAAHEP